MPSPTTTIANAVADLPAAPICVGFSGGLDSTVLLHALANATDTCRHGLRACHVHHGLQREADDWAARCESFCGSLGVPLVVRRVHVSQSGEGPEAAARRARHAAFTDELAPGEILAFAHHQDDQAETFLMRALRASGPDGLAAMPAWRTFGPGRLWRPLLDMPRSALEIYARAHKLKWIEDPSNSDPSIDRNFLRLQVLPLLRERWPHASDAFARSASLSAQAAELLNEEDAVALAGVATADPHTLSRTALQNLPAARRARVLRRWIAQLELPALPANGVARIEQDLLHARPDAQPTFHWQGVVVSAWRDLLHVRNLTQQLPADWRTDWDGRSPLTLPDGGGYRLEGINAFEQPLAVHARAGGERLQLPGRGHRSELKDVLQSLGVPPWERRQLPLLSTVDGQLLAAGDLVYSSDFDRWLRSSDARLRWLPPSPDRQKDPSTADDCGDTGNN